MAFLWSLVVIDPFIILSTILFGCVSIGVMWFDKSGDSAIRLAMVWARSLLWVSGVRVKVEGWEKVAAQGSFVICSNHLSYMDTPVILGHIPLQFRFLAKKGLFQIPFMGTHLTQAGHIPVPLEDARASVRTMNTAAQAIRDRGISMLIFPEGGRSLDGTLQPFKEGAAFIAIKAQVPLLPIALVGTREVMPMGSAVFHPFRQVTIRIGDPISTTGLGLRDRHELTADIRQQIAALLMKPTETSPQADLQASQP